MKVNIVKDLKEKIIKELFLSNENELVQSEIEIVNICADIINSLVDDKSDIEKENHKLKIELKNKNIEIEELFKELKLLKNGKI